MLHLVPFGLILGVLYFCYETDFFVRPTFTWPPLADVPWSPKPTLQNPNYNTPHQHPNLNTNIQSTRFRNTFQSGGCDISIWFYQITHSATSINSWCLGGGVKGSRSCLEYCSQESESMGHYAVGGSNHSSLPRLSGGRWKSSFETCMKTTTTTTTL